MKKPLRTAHFTIHSDPNGPDATNGIPAVWDRYSVSTDEVMPGSFQAVTIGPDGGPVGTTHFGRTEQEAFEKACDRLRRLATRRGLNFVEGLP